MMRLLLTILAALGFVWAALNNANAQELRALEPPAMTAPGESAADAAAADEAPVAAAAAAGPRQFGASRTDARVVIEAKEEAWVRISDADGRLVFMRTLKPGESYRVPNRSGLVLDSGNAKGLKVQVDGTPAPAFIGMVRRSIPLDPDTLPQGVFARPRPAPDAPAQAVAATTAPKTEPADAAPVAPAVVAAPAPAVAPATEASAETPAAPVAAAEPMTPPAAAIEPPKVAFDAPPLDESPKPVVEQPAPVAASTPAPPAPVIVAENPAAEKPATEPAVAAKDTKSDKPVVAEKKKETPRKELLTATLPLPAPREPETASAPAITPAVAMPDPVVPAAQPQSVAVVAPAPEPAAPETNVTPVVHASAAKAAAAPKPVASKPEPVKPAALPAPGREAVTNDGAKPASLTAPRAAAPAKSSAPAVTGAAAVAPSGVISAAGSRVTVEMQKGTLLRLDRPASTVFVADPEIADIQVKSAGLVYVFGKRAGETALFAVDDRERVVLSTTLVVNHNVSRLRQALRAVAPDAAVDVISVEGSLILTGTVYSAVEAENIRSVVSRFVGEKGTVINQLSVLAPNQVNLRVRIAEVSKETLKTFGINWESIARSGSFLFGLATGRDFINTAGTVFTRDQPVNTIVGSYRTGNQDINAAIDALATEGLISVLAEPNLTAMSGETASFLAGGEFPIPILQQANNSGSSGITVEFKTFGVGLAFTPTLLDEGRINLRVRPEVSQLSSAGAVQASGFSIPALTTRRAETTVELGSGQSFVIAGLLQNNTTQDLSRVPLLGDMPVLGTLFRSDRFRRNESELVIIVTPYIVRPVSHRVALPTDGFVPPNDVERIIGGTSYRQQLQDRGESPNSKQGQGLIGPTGFQLD